MERPKKKEKDRRMKKYKRRGETEGIEIILGFSNCTI